MRRACLAAVCVIFLAFAPATASRAQDGFDYYILALSIAPSFCDLTGYRAHKAQCVNPSDDDYQQTPLTLHGLWPNRRNTPTRQQPHACSDDPLPRLSDDLMRQLQTYMPGVADHLQDHEWREHGTCSGLAAEQYFAAMVALAAAANATIGAALRDDNLLGKEVDIRRLLDELGQSDPGLAQAIVVDCQTPRGGRGTYIAEIRVLLAPTLRDAGDSTAWPADFVPRDSVGMRAISGCRGGRGFLPGSFQD